MDVLLGIPAALSLFANPESVCIAGVSELFLRRCLANSYTLEVLKQIFVKLAELTKTLKSEGNNDEHALKYVLSHQLN